MTFTLFLPPVLILTVTAGLLLGLSWAAWRQRQAPGNRELAAGLLASGWWALMAAAEAGAASASAKIFWAQMAYFGYVGAGPSLLVFAARYTRQDGWLTPLARVALGLMPALTLGLVWLNAGQGLVVERGPWHWAQAGYNYALLLAATLLLARALLRTPRGGREPLLVFLAGLLGPALGALIGLLDWGPAPGVDWSVIGLAFTGVVYTWGLRRYHVLDPRPVAREALMDSLADGVLMLDTAGRVVDFNPAAQALLQRPAAAIQNQPWAALAGPGGSGGPPVEFELSLERAPERVLSGRATPLTDPFGRPAGHLLVLRDVTERRLLERRLRDMNANLERQVAERTDALVQASAENLRLAQQTHELQVLRAVDHLRSELIANVSHELRTPLGLIMLTSTLLIEQDAALTPAARREYLADIEAETRRLREVVDNLLDISRLQSGRMTLKRFVTNLETLARETVARLAPVLAGRPVALEFPAAPVEAWVDGVRVEQVLRNLLINAAKYSPAGRPITVRGRTEADLAVLEVRDHGPGIPAAEQARIFERFYRGADAHTQRTPGVGLGLAICQGIVAAHGGRLWVESVVGQGSTFSLALPRTRPPEPPSPLESETPDGN